MTLLRHWSPGPLWVVLLVPAVGYLVGLVRGRAGRSRTPAVTRSTGWLGRVRHAAFAVALLLAAVTLEGPVAYYARQLFWVHMAEQLLLVLVVAPLVVLAAPWPTFAAAVPATLRRRWPRARGAAAVGRAGADVLLLRRRGDWLWRPVPYWLATTGVFALWQLPVAADPAVGDPLVHAVASLSLLAAGLVFWTLVADSPPLQSPLGYLQRCVLIFLTAICGWVLGLVLGYGQRAFYRPYLLLPSRPGGLSALADQQLGAELLWASGMIAFSVAFVVCVYRWLTALDDPDRALADLVRQYVRRRANGPVDGGTDGRSHRSVGRRPTQW